MAVLASFFNFLSSDYNDVSSLGSLTLAIAKNFLAFASFF